MSLTTLNTKDKFSDWMKKEQVCLPETHINNIGGMKIKGQMGKGIPDKYTQAKS